MANHFYGCKCSTCTKIRKDVNMHRYSDNYCNDCYIPPPIIYEKPEYNCNKHCCKPGPKGPPGPSPCN